MESTLMLVAYILLSAALVLSLISFWQSRHTMDHFAAIALGLAFLVLMAALAARWMDLERLPVTSLYEFSLLFVWGILSAYLIMRRFMKAPSLTMLVGFITFIILSYVGTLSPEAMPLMPALKSRWLTAHVMTAIIAYGAFAIAFCLSLLYLVKIRMQEPEVSGKIPAASQLDRFAHGLIVVGFAFQTLVLVTGAVWAEEAWGHWWQWDPKETWALITWLVYAVYLHGYKSGKVRDKKAAIVSIVGFAVVIFTMFGVTFLLGGMHAY